MRQALNGGDTPNQDQDQDDDDDDVDGDDDDSKDESRSDAKCDDFAEFDGRTADLSNCDRSELSYS